MPIEARRADPDLNRGRGQLRGRPRPFSAQAGALHVGTSSACHIAKPTLKSYSRPRARHSAAEPARLRPIRDLCRSPIARYLRDELMAQLTRSRSCGARMAVIVVAIALQFASGCKVSLPRWDMGGWLEDYESAETQARNSDSELMIYYKRVTPGFDDPMHDALKSPPVDQLIEPYVRCVLSPSYEPDRRYVGQYGVERAPALIVVHRDGTYHARTGLVTEPQITQFLSDVVGPGRTPAINLNVRRSPKYAWHRSLESAQEEGQRTGKPILIVFDRWLSGDWMRLRAMLARREVYIRFADMVHCRPNSVFTFGRSGAARFGVDNLPAIVIMYPDGTSRALELPSSYEAIARFADRARLAGSLGEDSVAAPAATAAQSRKSADGMAVPTTGPDTTNAKTLPEQ